MRFARSGFVVLLVVLALAPTARAGEISWGSPDGTYFRPVGVAVGSDGNLYVTDTDRVGVVDHPQPRVVEFQPDGTYVNQWALANESGRVAADSMGHLYAASDVFTDDVKKYLLDGSTGMPTRFTCSSDPQPVCIDNPAGVAIGAGNNLYVASSANSLIFRFDASTGTELGHWAASDPRDVAAAPNGDVYVPSYNGGAVSRYHADGSPAGSFPSSFPSSVAVDSAGNVYVGSSDGVRKYDSAGNYIGIWEVTNNVAAVAVDSLGRVFVARPAGKPSLASGGQVMRLDPATETPTPALTASPATPLASQLVTFDASASKPPAFGTITHYEWDLDGNGTFETDGGTSSTISRRFAQAGTETVRVRVSASVGMSATEAITLNIGTPYTFTSAMPGLVVTGQPVTFDAGPSAMEGSDIERFQWDFDGDGTYETDTGTTSSVQHAYATPGVFTASVRVTRSGGRVDSATAPVEVRLAPPAGEVGVSINGGAFATNDPHVTLSLVWPVNADSLLASNDGGFGDAGSTQVFPVAPEVGWTLPSAGAERLPKTVYVRFRVSGTSGSETYTDDIVLDQDAPAVTSAQASHRVLRVKALDGNTGVASLIVTRPHAKLPLKTKQLAPAGSQASTRVTTTVQLPRGLRRAYVRAVDAVGNKSRWRWIKFR